MSEKTQRQSQLEQALEAARERGDAQAVEHYEAELRTLAE